VPAIDRVIEQSVDFESRQQLYTLSAFCAELWEIDLERKIRNRASKAAQNLQLVALYIDLHEEWRTILLDECVDADRFDLLLVTEGKPCSKPAVIRSQCGNPFRA